MKESDALAPVHDPPLIGVTGGRQPDLAGDRAAGPAASAAPSTCTTCPYVAGIAAAGGIPVQVPREADPVALLRRLDGLRRRRRGRHRPAPLRPRPGRGDDPDRSRPRRLRERADRGRPGVRRSRCSGSAAAASC